MGIVTPFNADDRGVAESRNRHYARHLRASLARIGLVRASNNALSYLESPAGASGKHSGVMAAL